MKAGLFIIVLFLVVGFISMPNDEPAPASRAAPLSQLNQADIMAAVQAMPAMQNVKVQVKLQKLRTAFMIYVDEFNDVPDPAGGLKPLADVTGMVSASDLRDPWGNDFVYRRSKVSGNSFWDEFEVQVFSAGPDGVADTADDIHLP
jgi:hypothetical protein